MNNIWKKTKKQTLHVKNDTANHTEEVLLSENYYTFFLLNVKKYFRIEAGI